MAPRDSVSAAYPSGLARCKIKRARISGFAESIPQGGGRESF